MCVRVYVYVCVDVCGCVYVHASILGARVSSPTLAIVRKTIFQVCVCVRRAFTPPALPSPPPFGFFPHTCLTSAEIMSARACVFVTNARCVCFCAHAFLRSFAPCVCMHVCL
eukprot:GDKI01036451.1.p3 GENE.GDKI01036451.1~~GDKI01036451.1.p3  ORF type:complete len:112 (+),score=27.97 GDKI01036451.1:323-658(+)